MPKKPAAKKASNVSSFLTPKNASALAPTHEQRREKAFWVMPSWRDKPLTWALSSEQLYSYLRVVMNAPAIWAARYDRDYLPEAVRLLFAASATPEERIACLAMAGADLVAVMQAWADENISLHETDQAIDVMNEILNNAVFNRAVPIAPESGATSGN